eukprot:gene515-650_t
MGRSDDEDNYGEEEEEEDAFDGDEEEEDDYEEEEDDYDRGSKKSKHSSFFEEEADVDEDDDDEDGDYDGGPQEPGWTKDLEQEVSRSNHREFDVSRTRDYDSIEEEARRFIRRGMEMDQEDDDYMDDELPRQSYWRLKCRPGEEKLFVATMMQKMLNNQNHPTEKVLLKSVMAPQHLPGHIYVEAERAEHIKSAIKGMHSILPNAPQLIPLKDIIEVLSTSKKSIDLKKGTWIRVKLGKYKGDIGQIINYDSTKSKVIVKIIPRIDPVETKESKEAAGGSGNNSSQSTSSQSSTTTSSQSQSQGTKRKKARPQARFFSSEEAIKMGHQVQKRGAFYLIGSEKFKDGFLHKVLRTSSIIVDNIVPTLEELQKFQDRDDESNRRVDDDEDDEYGSISRSDNAAPILPSVISKPVLFSKGDTVKVIEGDLKNLMGTVESIDENSVTILPKGLDEPLLFKASELQKFFKIGDHVKAISGRYEGETGLVLRVEDLTVVLLSDLSMSEIKVKPQDIQECTEIATGKLELGNYELHDLVQISPHKVGIIIKVERDSFKILDEGSNVTTVKLQEVGNKRRNRGATTLDAHQNTVTAGDVIEVVDGLYRGKQGSILHISRNFLFLKSKDVFENGGVFVVRPNYCSLLGGQKNRPPNQFPQQHGGDRGGGGGGRYGGDRGGGGGGDRGGGGGGFQRRGGRREDTPLHKTVTIKSGTWKGYVGIVKECTDTMVQVELQTNSKKINVQRTNIQIAGERSHSNNDWDNQQSLHMASRTPVREDPSMTPRPMHHSSNDPWSMRSSEHSSSSSYYNDNDNTPSDFSTTTPGTNYSTYSPYTPNTPSEIHRQESNYGYDRPTPIGIPTPNNNYDISTPGYVSYEQPTPQDTPASPFTPHNPQTPSTPSTPAGEYPEDEADTPIWQGTNVEVVFKDSHTHAGKHAIVLDNTEEGVCKVKLLNNNEIVNNVHQDHLDLVLPVKKDRVVVVRGHYTGNVGTLFVITGLVGIVKVDKNLDYKVFKMTQLGKLA